MKFKEDLIFELEKDNPIRSGKRFNEHLHKTYGFVAPNSDIRTKIINYQLSKYGGTIGDSIKKIRKFEIIRERYRRKSASYRRKNG